LRPTTSVVSYQAAEAVACGFSAVVEADLEELLEALEDPLLEAESAVDPSSSPDPPQPVQRKAMRRGASNRSRVRWDLMVMGRVGWGLQDRRLRRAVGTGAQNKGPTDPYDEGGRDRVSAFRGGPLGWRLGCVVSPLGLTQLKVARPGGRDKKRQ
jgi:hypothetical protein